MESQLFDSLSYAFSKVDVAQLGFCVCEERGIDVSSGLWMIWKVSCVWFRWWKWIWVWFYTEGIFGCGDDFGNDGSGFRSIFSLYA